MSFELALQQTINDTLTAAGLPTLSADFVNQAYTLGNASQQTGVDTLNDLAAGVYDNVPQPNDGGNASAFPYVVIGEDDFQDWSTDTESGADATVTIHCWSRYRGRKEIKQMQGAIYSALHRATLVVDGYDFITCDFLSSNSLVDQDGFTRHGIQNFRVILDQA